jgi:chromosome segregation ATPase
MEAQQQLRTAIAEEQRAKSQAALEQIKILTAQGAALRAELEPLVAQIKQAQDERLRLHAELMRARTQVNHYSAPLDPLTFPSAEDEAERLRQLDLWQAEQARLLAAHRAAMEREAVRPRAIRLANQLNALQYSISNLSAVAEGRTPGSIEGGLFTVEDFLSSAQPLVRPQN